MKIEQMPLSQLLARRFERNPKQHSIDDLVLSFRRFGFRSPPSLDESTGILVAGHGRITALERLRANGEPPPDGIEQDGGEWMVPVVRGLTFANERERNAFVIADNNLTIAGGWDASALRDLLDDLKDDGGLDGLGFDTNALDALLEDGTRDLDVVHGDADTPEPPIPDPPRDPITKSGDIWMLGRHRLLCGDCRTDISRLLPHETADIAITSPPYASQRSYDEDSGFRPIAPDAYVDWFDAVQATVARHLAPDGSWFLNIKAHAKDGARSLYVLDLVLAHARRWGWLLVDEFCWRNTRNGVPGVWPNRFKNAWEPVFHFAKQASLKMRPLSVSTSTMDAFEYSNNNSQSRSGSGLLGSDHSGQEGVARPSNVIEAAAESSQGKHTAPFPLALPSFFIAAFTDEDDIVLEPFAGSGTTLIAAEQLGRRCRAVEISPAYCDVIIERWETLTGGDAVRKADR